MTTKSMPSALLDFRRARRQAELESLLARLSGKSVDLLCYDDVQDKMHGTRAPRSELRDIELDRIVGSVGRCTDFTRSFLPLQDSDERRWARADLKMDELSGLPPIEVYELGGVYFVQEGHHRVSVARHSGATHLQAHVTKVRSRVRLPPDVDPEDVILQAERSEFLSKTHLDELRPGSNVEASVPGQFGKLLEHIDVHRYFMGLDEERPIPYGEAAAHWHDHVYLPVVEVIRAQGILQDFPGRTEADLYLWLAEHRRELKDELGWVVDTAVAAEDLAEQLGRDNQPFLRRIGRMLMRAVTPPELAGGAPPGARRAERLFAGREEQLFRDVLVAVDGRDSGWRALEQVGLLSRLEPLRAHGLHVVAPERSDGDERFVREEFDKRFGTLGVAGELTMGTGDIAEEIAELAHWTDLVVLGLDIPPEKRPIARIGSGVRRIISRSPRPILFVPGRPSPLDRAVLAYDGSPNAEEALFVSAYAAERWGISLKVVTAQELSKPQPETLRGACLYLEEQGVEATAIAAKGGPAEAIMETVESAGANLIIMGGYRFGPVLELVLGSTVDRVLRESCVPVLVCR